MAQMKQSMNLKQLQSLRMTPQLQQAIKMLQLNRLELETEIRRELDENPVLEEMLESTKSEEGDTVAAEKSTLEEHLERSDQDPQKTDEFDWENYVDSTYKPPTGSMGSEEISNFENIMSSGETLFDHLMWQVGLSGFDEEEERLAEILVNYIDDDGYIKTPLEQIADEEKVTAKELEEVLPFVQEFDPPGVGARSLQECLLIQAKHLQEDTHDLVLLIQTQLKNLEKKNFEGIAKEMGVTLEDVIEMSKIIYSMDPKPGRLFSVSDTQYVTPDVYVYKVGDEYVVSLNEDGLPKLKISNFYKNVLQSGEGAEKTQDYIQEKLKSALWLIKSIHQRQRTIYKVTESIVKHQQEFFEKGREFIRPMILRDIANDIGMHESTVSRVTTSKYLHTPQGIFELKYFFNSGISKTDGDSLASESVKLKIRDLVTAEDPKNPLSDQQLVDLLKKAGLKIARRTVAKYREMLKILPSSKRKKYF
jgi:RNA polymerase sigma-54 factor